MEGVLQTLFLGLPVFLGHFGVALLMLGIGVVLYLLITPVMSTVLSKKEKVSCANLGARCRHLDISRRRLAGSVNLWDIAFGISLSAATRGIFFGRPSLGDLAHRIRAGMRY